MKDKEMIEEMERDIPSDIVACNGKPNGLHLYIEQKQEIAKAFYYQGYRQCKDKVVLSREEYEDLKIAKDFDYGYHDGESNMTSYYENIRLPEARKETAREILTEIAKRLHRAIMSGYWEYPKIEDLFEKYGVEVEE